MKVLTQERLKECLFYDPDTGIWTWLKPSGKRAKIGVRAGKPHKSGYWIITIDNRGYISSVLAFFYMTGRWPIRQIDHKNGVRDDDRWENLREATQQQNNYNQKIRKDNTSGCKGVCWRPKRNKWFSFIFEEGKQKGLGCYDTFEEAKKVRLEAEKKSVHSNYFREMNI